MLKLPAGHVINFMPSEFTVSGCVLIAGVTSGDFVSAGSSLVSSVGSRRGFRNEMGWDENRAKIAAE